MKLDRLLAIIMLIINRKKVSAEELARYFEVSVRTIYRDFEAINMAGIPIVAYPGKNGGFGVMEGYRIDRHILTPEEILSIVSALKGIGKSIDGTGAVATAEKLKSLLPDEEKRRLARREETLLIDPSPWTHSGSRGEKIGFIRNAIDGGRVLSFSYTDGEGNSRERSIEPMTLMLKGSAWYLFGYCRLRADYRVFRISRIKSLCETGEIFVRREQAYDPDEWSDLWSDKPIVRLVLRFSPRARMRVEELFFPEQIRTLEDGFIHVTADYPEGEWVYGTILSFGEDVEVLEPGKIRGRIREKAAAIVEKY